MADLTPRQAEVWRVYRESGENAAETARRLNVQRGTVTKTLQRVRALLGGVRSEAPSVSNGQGVAPDSGDPPGEADAWSRDDDPLGLLRPEGDATRAGFAAPPTPASAPKGWEPGVAWKGKEGTLCVALDEPPDAEDWDALLAVWDLDPKRYCIVGEPEFRAWDTAAKSADGEIVARRLFYYKARIGLRARFVPDDELERLTGQLGAVHVPEHRPGSDVDLVVCLADWQLGKGDGDGLEGTVRRALRGIEGVPDMVADLERLGRRPSRIHVQGMGDIVEQCDGHYPAQAFTTVLNRRDQTKVARRLACYAVERFAPLADRITVSAVPGNHGENRKNGKRFTSDGDNDDVAVFEQVADIVARVPSLSHVAFVLPEDEMQVVLEIGGAVVGFHHGHVGQSGSTPQAKAKRWWADMVFSQTELQGATILVTAHYHHFSVIDHGPRWHIQCPTIDGGSKWWTDRGGGSSRAGTLAFTVADGVPGDWRIL